VLTAVLGAVIVVGHDTQFVEPVTLSWQRVSFTPTAAVLALVAAVCVLAAWSASAETVIIGADEALARAEAGEITIVDIRSPAEWAETGLPARAVGATLLDDARRPRPAFLDEILALVEGDRSRPIALICARGNRSALAARLLAEQGFTRLHDIGEGMIGGAGGPGWLARDLPTSPCRAC
jgi:rhodanese-related sulfurtransferase